MFSVRLTSLRKAKNKTQQNLADFLGITRPAYTAYEGGSRQPDYNTLQKIADYFDVSVDYLLGRSENQSMNKSAAIPGLPTEFFTYLPVVAEISCGIPTFTQDEIVDYFPADNSMLNGGEYVWLKAKGDSMINAMIADGSKVLLRLQPMVENGEIAAVCIDYEDATLKKVYISDKTVTLVSENPGYKDQVYDKNRITIKGKAVYVGSAL